MENLSANEEYSSELENNTSHYKIMLLSISIRKKLKILQLWRSKILAVRNKSFWNYIFIKIYLIMLLLQQQFIFTLVFTFVEVYFLPFVVCSS